MHKLLLEMKEELTEIIAIINDSNISLVEGETFASRYGWNQLQLDSSDLISIVRNFISDLDAYNIQDVGGNESYIKEQIEKIRKLSLTMEAYYKAEPSHLIHIASNFIVTITTIHNDIKALFFTWKAAEDKKLLPSQLIRRLRATEARLSNFESSCTNLESKIKLINSAHEAAETLPIDLEELKKSNIQAQELLKYSRELSEQIKDYNTLSNSLFKRIEDLEQAALSNKNKTDSYVQECDEALQITTTQGLSAGFDRKAKDLSISIITWTVGLIISLITVAVVGYFRINSLSALIQGKVAISLGEGLIQLSLTIISVGGPLWFAWLATQQINQRFKLSEDYSYKSTVAKSYTGFSKQANRFGPDIEERLFNATLDRLEEMPLRLIEAKDYNSPWHEFIDSDAVKEAIRMFPSLAREINTYAKNIKQKTTGLKSATNKLNDTEDNKET